MNQNTVPRSALKSFETRVEHDRHLLPLEGGKSLFPAASPLKVFYHSLSIQTEQENLTQLDPRLKEFLQPSDYFYVHDITQDLKDFVFQSGLKDGTLTVQILHTSASLAVNELDEPMLLGDLVRKLRHFVPKDESYLHNSPLRHVNRCEEDTHCDRNADAHVRTFLFGHPSVSLIIRNGELVVGRWQKVALIEFDGPRPREVLIQGMGV